MAQAETAQAETAQADGAGAEFAGQGRAAVEHCPSGPDERFLLRFLPGHPRSQ